LDRGRREVCLRPVPARAVSGLNLNSEGEVKKEGSSLFSVGSFLPTQDGSGSHPQIAQIPSDVFMVSTLLPNLKSAAGLS
jgi:hypothetical protein